MNTIRHQITSRDSLYEELSANMTTVRELWANGNRTLRFSIPILCAAKLEAFINVAGRLHVEDWDNRERKLTFKKKCQVIFASQSVQFDASIEPIRTALEIFELRNELVHPKMLVEESDEEISMEEYHRRQTALLGVAHPLRASLNKKCILRLLDSTEEFVALFGNRLLRGAPEYWLGRGATGTYTRDAGHAG